MINFFKKIYKFLHPKFQVLYLEYKVNFKPRYGQGHPPHGLLYQIINENRISYENLLNNVLQFKDKLWEIRQNKVETNPVLPTWNNANLPGLDICVLYTMIIQLKPKMYLEIGSGNSTKVVFKAKNDFNLTTKIISIDPFPRAEIDKITDLNIRQGLEDIDLSLLDQLDENDILFIDNSHIILPNSDAMVFFMEMLPRLKKGVVVQIHDIYLPYDYPQFMCDRNYNEQYGLAICLLSNKQKYQVLCPNYFISEDSELSKLISPIWENINLTGVEKHGGSFWFKVSN